MPHEEARTRACMATAYWGEGETELAELEALAARATFDGLSAAADLEHINALIAENS